MIGVPGCASRALRATLLSIVIVAPAIAGDIAPADLRSGYSFMSRENQAMQDDPTTNPGSLWVLDGEALWGRRVGKADRSCADCHDSASTSMKGVDARYPAFDAASGRPINLETRISQCRSERQQAAPFRRESRELNALAAFVANQSRGVSIPETFDKRLTPFVAQGRALFGRRQGQLNLSCAQCHTDNWDKRLSGAVIPQGHANGYPLYRLEWQSVGSLERRLRNCMTGMRAEPYEYGAPESVAIELYLMWRARGLPIETPAVRP